MVEFFFWTIPAFAGYDKKGAALLTRFFVKLVPAKAGICHTRESGYRIQSLSSAKAGGISSAKAGTERCTAKLNRPEYDMLSRIYESVIQRHLDEDRQMVFLAGPRQVGKTTCSKYIETIY